MTMVLLVRSNEWSSVRRFMVLPPCLSLDRLQGGRPMHERPSKKLRRNGGCEMQDSGKER
jgi:hypothetical protein